MTLTATLSRPRSVRTGMVRDVTPADVGDIETLNVQLPPLGITLLEQLSDEIFTLDGAVTLWKVELVPLLLTTVIVFVEDVWPV